MTDKHFIVWVCTNNSKLFRGCFEDEEEACIIKNALEGINVEYDVQIEIVNHNNTNQTREIHQALASKLEKKQNFYDTKKKELSKLKKELEDLDRKFTAIDSLFI